MNKDLTAMDEIRDKQVMLMESVPHPLRQDAMDRMHAAKKLIEGILVYLNSTGHKPWRPNPLPQEEQTARLLGVIDSFSALAGLHTRPATPEMMNDSVGSRMLVSTFGGIEECIEFYDSWFEHMVDQAAYNSPAKVEALKDDRAHMLEELTDELFYFLERMVLVNFTWEQVISEYYRKWEVNMKRYADAKKGDFTWDDRAKKEGL